MASEGETSADGIEQALTHVKRAQEYRKRRKWRAVKQELNAAEYLLERSIDTGLDRPGGGD